MGFPALAKPLVLVSILFFTSKLGRALDQPELGAAGVVANEYLPPAEDEGDGDHSYPGAGGTEDEGDKDHYYPKEGGYYPKEGGATGTNPDVIIDKALECFNDKYIYRSCEETYRLTQSGEVNVPPEYTDQFCNGPCLAETHHVLDCINGIFKHFEFYNKATIYDIRETIDTGCSYGPKRGDFNVAEHIETDDANANKMSRPVFYAVMIVMGWHVLL